LGGSEAGPPEIGSGKRPPQQKKKAPKAKKKVVNTIGIEPIFPGRNVANIRLPTRGAAKVYGWIECVY